MPLTLALVPHHVRTQGGGERWTSTATWLLVAAHGMGSRPPLLRTSWGPVWTLTVHCRLSSGCPAVLPALSPTLLRTTGLHFSFPRWHFPTTAHRCPSHIPWPNQTFANQPEPPPPPPPALPSLLDSVLFMARLTRHQLQKVSPLTKTERHVSFSALRTLWGPFCSPSQRADSGCP